ncbi:MAG: hypothetical protein M3Q33_13785, partial [Acidobacteriota bacterium]|nr:hypothetical protein [Acidobacteriota bacterium]
LIDGGNIQLPNRAAYNPDGSTWGIENIGVSPDYDVEITLQDFMAGKDAQLEKAVEVALAEIAKLKPNETKLPVFPIHPGKQETSSGNLTLPTPGSAFPAPIQQAEVKPVTDGKFAAYLGQFDTPMGVVSFSQEGEKLIGLAGGERIELSPDAAVKDKFIAQTASVTVTFERDTNGKIIGVTVIIPSGREVKGKKIN